MTSRGFRICIMIVCLSLLLCACALKPPTISTTITHPQADRADALPTDVEKRTPEADFHPPILHVDDFEAPVPLPLIINTSGLEDSPYILPDGETLFFFFTPDARVPASEQLLDNVTGIWVSEKEAGNWGTPRRVWLQEPGKLALDGCPMIAGDTLWFCSAREGYVGVTMFTATGAATTWEDINHADARLVEEIAIGEVHIYQDTLYFHSPRQGGKGGYDIWITHFAEGAWSDPVNLDIINSTADEALPFVSSDGTELWFTRTYLGTPAIFRSIWGESGWGEPELIVSQFAGEPTLDQQGNLYFVHHFFENDVMIEADIYVCVRKQFND